MQTCLDKAPLRTIDIIRELIRVSKIPHIQSRDNYLGLSLLRICRKSQRHCCEKQRIFRISGLSIKEVHRDPKVDSFEHSYIEKPDGLVFNFAAPDSVLRFIEFLQVFK